MRKGLFITFEGCDGCGKTTQIERLSEYLKSIGKDVVLTKEPGGTDLGDELRHILKYSSYSICPLSEILIFNASRAQLCSDVIYPALEKDKIVISDRFYHSSIAYQSNARGIDKSVVENICKIATDGLEPDVVFWLDISAEEAFIRKGGAEKGERLEESGIEFHNKVYDGYKQLYDGKKSNIVRIDASKSIDDVLSQVLLTLRPMLE